MVSRCYSPAILNRLSPESFSTFQVCKWKKHSRGVVVWIDPRRSDADLSGYSPILNVSSLGVLHSFTFFAIVVGSLLNALLQCHKRRVPTSISLNQNHKELFSSNPMHIRETWSSLEFGGDNLLFAWLCVLMTSTSSQHRYCVGWSPFIKYGTSGLGLCSICRPWFPFIARRVILQIRIAISTKDQVCLLKKTPTRFNANNSWSFDTPCHFDGEGRLQRTRARCFHNGGTKRKGILDVGRLTILESTFSRYVLHSIGGAESATVESLLTWIAFYSFSPHCRHTSTYETSVPFHTWRCSKLSETNITALSRFSMFSEFTIKQIHCALLDQLAAYFRLACDSLPFSSTLSNQHCK